MKILLTLQNYHSLTGSEMYVYELARVLHKRNHEVAIMALNIKGEIAERTTALGIPVFRFFEHPELSPDIVHANQPLPTIYSLRFFRNVPHVVTIHSLMKFEEPIKDPYILEYIAIRNDIKEKYLSLSPKVILNGVDMNRFKPADTVSDKEAVLFVGTMDHLRMNVIADLVARTEKEGKELWLVSNIPEEMVKSFPDHVKVSSPTWHIEEAVKRCKETAGIFMGRTTIEGWACGKGAYIYDVDASGGILDIKFSIPPADMSTLDIEYMTDRVLETYEEVLK